jgi:hypothetical protein
VRAEEQNIHIKVEDAKVNSANILEVAGIYKLTKQQFENLGMTWEAIIDGPKRARGRYVSAADALKLCERYGLSNVFKLLEEFFKHRKLRDNSADIRDEHDPQQESSDHGPSDRRSQARAESQDDARIGSFFSEQSYSHGLYLPVFKGGSLDD